MRRNELLVGGQFTSIPLSVLSDQRLSPGGKLVYAALLDRLGNNPWSYPSLNWIARTTALSRRGVIKCIQDLEALNYIFIIRRPRRNYYVLFDGYLSRDQMFHYITQDSELSSLLPSEHNSPTLVNSVHQIGEQGALKLVNRVHPNHTSNQNNQQREPGPPSFFGPDRGKKGKREKTDGKGSLRDLRHSEGF